MKIVHVGFNHRPNDIRIFYKECMSLNKHGYQVFYITSDKNADAMDVNREIKVTIIHLHETNRIDRFWKFCNELKKLLCLLDADVYHFHEMVLLPVLLYMQRRGKHVIYDMHEDSPRQLQPFVCRRYGKILGMLLMKVTEIYENYCIRKADYVITATPHIEERCKKLTSMVMCVANFPIIHSNENMDNLFEKKEKAVCYTGGISEINGIFHIMEAMQYVDGTLYLAGGLSQELKDKLMKYDSWGKVKELGYVDRKNVREIMQKSMAGLVLYLPAGNTMEALPNKLFEYMEAGLPVIASNFPFWKKIVEKNQCGICIDPAKPEEIADAINRILSSPKWAEGMGKNGKRVVQEKYNWEAEEKKLLEVYEHMEDVLNYRNR